MNQQKVSLTFDELEKMIDCLCLPALQISQGVGSEAEKDKHAMKENILFLFTCKFKFAAIKQYNIANMLYRKIDAFNWLDVTIDYLFAVYIMHIHN